ncbi:ECF-type sigma factor [Pelomonas cellulosilytica]|uniref:Sigma-70 family RNA polymerase sigma factor n=1 Tax=Pelomonas cellulosilytica TaxID=2906762 RepID=A0ABS8XRU5_9BURK|nr:sigma-70 family RNA polymerase sigma factor [Pelomonas sp. P8]
MNTIDSSPLPTLDPALRDELYRELRQLARQRLRRSGPMTLLHTTDLVHEGWLKLARTPGWQSLEPAHFMAYAATVMRSIVVDYARARQTQQRGGGATHVPLDELPTLAHRDDEYLQIHDALTDLERQDPRLARLVELRFFVGLEETECAEALGQSRRTVQRDWQKARALLWASLND